MRTKNSIINVLTGWGTQVVKIIVGFIARTVFIHLLSVEYLGLSGTFTSVLQILSFAELGIGGAILVSLYKPIADRDYNEQIALYQLYRRIFRIIGLVVATLGLVLTPFLNFFIKEIPDIPYIKLIYLLFVINSSISYFMAHKSTYFTAIQKNYVIRLVHSSIYVLMLIVQSMVLILTKNYILYLIVQIIATISENIVWSILIRKYYSFLNNHDKKEISKEKKRELLINIKAVIFFKIGNVIVNSTDSLILSKYVGIVAAGMYSNYYMIITSIDSVLSQVFTSMAASIGDLHVNADNEKQQDVFENIMFLGFVIYTVSMITLGVMINDVIRLWIGKEFLFSRNVVIIITISFYMQGYRKVLGMYREACGLYNYTKYTTLFEAIANLILSIIFVNKFEIAGIFLGTIFSHLMFGFWKEPLVLYKFVFKNSVREYWKKYLGYAIVLIALIIAMQKLGQAIIVVSWLGIVMKSMLVSGLSIFILIVMFFKIKEFKFFLSLQKIIINKLMKR